MYLTVINGALSVLQFQISLFIILIQLTLCLKSPVELHMSSQGKWRSQHRLCISGLAELW